MKIGSMDLFKSSRQKCLFPLTGIIAPMRL